MHIMKLLSINVSTFRPTGTTFTVTKADCVLPRRAVRGDVVTFTHDSSRRITNAFLAQGTPRTHRDAQRQAIPQEVVRGVPANSVVHRIRADLSWEDVVGASGLPVRQFRNGLSLPLISSLLLTLCLRALVPTFNSFDVLYRTIPED